MDLEDIHVIPAKKKQFAERGIGSVEDLLSYLPRDYKDYRAVTGILPDDQTSVVRMTVKSIEKKYSDRRDYIVADCKECKSGEIIKVFWFGIMWIYSKLEYMIGKTVVAAGKIDYKDDFGYYTMCHPEFFEANESCLRIYPVYKSIPHMSPDYLRSKISDALKIGTDNSEIFPEDIIRVAQVAKMPDALQYIHNPQTMEQVAEGQKRILFNDLIYFAVKNEINHAVQSPGSQYNIVSRELVNKIESDLPFDLTPDQKTVVSDILSCAEQGKRINALLQADVGAGKTICAALLAAAFIDNGYQAVLMAPTQVLAKQHFENLSSMFGKYGINTVYLDSKLKTAEKRKAIKAIKDGTAQMIIGTHSCTAKDVEYKALALTIVDEEHRFGVQQRNAIIEKGAKGVHNLTMSATPIPRSLASVVYGDEIQMYTIRSMPSGRKPVITKICTEEEKIFAMIRQTVQDHHQVYVVCPMIDSTEKAPNVQSVEEVSAKYLKKLAPYGITIDTLTGKDSPEQIADTIKRFQSNEINVLVSTTVVEVGVDVKNATLIVINNAERFGLSSLHQLRGRVGRNQLQSYCILHSSDASENAGLRLNVMCETTDGFKIASADLMQRGAGDLIGTQQSGSNKYIELIIKYPERYQYAVRVAKKLIQRGRHSCPLMEKISQEYMEP